MSIERVLIVEDDEALLRSLSRTLDERFGEVRGCRTRAEARALIATWHPQLVLLDVVLPDGDAFDVLREAQASAPSPAVVVMSGSASGEQARALEGLGVRAWLRKPLTTRTLERAIGDALAERGTPTTGRPSGSDGDRV